MRPGLASHLHGHLEAEESLVLTENDYLDFLVGISENRNQLLPDKIQDALASTSLLFLGYSLTDWDFRVIFRSIVYYLAKNDKAHVSVQLEPERKADMTDQELENIISYLQKYYALQKIEVFWGDCKAFAETLKQKKG